MNLKDYGIAVGNPADIVVLDCADPGSAVAEAGAAGAGHENTAHISFSACAGDAQTGLTECRFQRNDAMQTGLTA